MEDLQLHGLRVEDADVALVRHHRVVGVGAVELALPQEAAVEVLGLPHAAGQFLPGVPVQRGDPCIVDGVVELPVGGGRLVGERRRHRAGGDVSHPADLGRSAAHETLAARGNKEAKWPGRLGSLVR